MKLQCEHVGECSPAGSAGELIDDDEQAVELAKFIEALKNGTTVVEPVEGEAEEEEELSPYVTQVATLVSNPIDVVCISHLGDHGAFQNEGGDFAQLLDVFLPDIQTIYEKGSESGVCLI